MRVYIAASSREVERVREAQRMVAEQGWTLTLDWLTGMLANIERGIRDSDLSADEQLRHATEDIEAIESADVLWLLAPREPTKGAWYEVGYADAYGTPVVVSGGCPSIFLRRAHVLVDTDAEAPAAIALLVCAVSENPETKRRREQRRRQRKDGDLHAKEAKWSKDYRARMDEDRKRARSEQRKASWRRLREKRLAAGLCPRCTEPMDREGYMCRACCDHHAEQCREARRDPAPRSS